MSEEAERGFDQDKAELFEAIGHPNRIKIIQALDQGGMGFAELKKKVGMESSGHLAFHLGKLEHLVVMDPNGQYVLTGEGREAMRMIQTVREKEGAPRHAPRISVRRPLIAALLVVIVVLAAVAAIQQLELANNSGRIPGTTVLNGASYSYAVIPLTSLPAKQNTTVWFGGVEFTLIPYQPQILTVRANQTSGVEIFPVRGNFTGGIKIGGIPEGIPVTGTFSLLSPAYNVQMRFADGKMELMIPLPSTNSQGITYFSVATSNTPWFSVHASPRAGVSENMTAVTLYVGF